MNVEEIQAALDELVLVLRGKGVPSPDAEFSVNANRDPVIWLKSSDNAGGFGYRMFRAFDAATDFATGLPSPQDAINRTFLKKAAEAVDYGHANGVDAQYVDPMRVAMQAMSDNLLTVIP